MLEKRFAALDGVSPVFQVRSKLRVQTARWGKIERPHRKVLFGGLGLPRGRNHCRRSTRPTGLRLKLPLAKDENGASVRICLPAEQGDGFRDLH